MSEWMTTGEIARELGIVPQTVRRMLIRENVPFRKGGKWMVRRTDFEAMVARQFRS